jgi:hypothetical protein
MEILFLETLAEPVAPDAIKVTFLLHSGEAICDKKTCIREVRQQSSDEP